MASAVASLDRFIILWLYDHGLILRSQDNDDMSPAREASALLKDLLQHV
jgi:hypothetical protein